MSSSLMYPEHLGGLATDGYKDTCAISSPAISTDEWISVHVHDGTAIDYVAVYSGPYSGPTNVNQLMDYEIWLTNASWSSSLSNDEGHSHKCGAGLVIFHQTQEIYRGPFMTFCGRNDFTFATLVVRARAGSVQSVTICEIEFYSQV